MRDSRAGGEGTSDRSRIVMLFSGADGRRRKDYRDAV